MMNYIKSELYRITHTVPLYITAFILAFLGVFYNTVNYLFDTQYATTSFSYSSLVAMPTLFVYAGAAVAGILYEDNRRNGNLKNTIAAGLSRGSIFAGKCVVSVLAAIAVMVTTLFSWIVSAELLLHRMGPVQLQTLLWEVPAVFFLAAAGVILLLALMELCGNMLVSLMGWSVILLAVPRILLYLGMRYELVYKIALWFPSNLFYIVNQNHVNLSECVTAWDTAGGMLRCVVPGIVGCLVFTLAGILLVRRRDL